MDRVCFSIINILILLLFFFFFLGSFILLGCSIFSILTKYTQLLYFTLYLLLLLFSSLVTFLSFAITKLGFDPEREKGIKFKEEQRLIFHRNPNFLFLVLLGFCDLWGFVKR